MTDKQPTLITDDEIERRVAEATAAAIEAEEAEIVHETSSEAPQATAQSRQSELARQVDDALDPDASRGLWPLARELAKTEFVGEAMRGKPGAVLAAILTGRELGVGAMRSLANISIIDGRPRLSASLQLALVRQAGHRVEGTSDATRAEITGTRRETAEQITVIWTLEDAQRAGLVDDVVDGVAKRTSSSGKPMPWQSYTPSMLWARAVTTLVERLFSDVVTFGPGE